MSKPKVIWADNPEPEHEDTCPADWILAWLGDPDTRHTIARVVEQLGCSLAEAVLVINSARLEVLIHRLDPQ